MATAEGSKQISLFRSQIQNRKFDDEAFRILESILASKDVKSSIQVQLTLKDFMRHESLIVIREIALKSVDYKLMIVDFFVRAFALIGDVESCLALRYEALIMRDVKAAIDQKLKVSDSEWTVFAQQSLDNGFYSIASKACERALLCLPMSTVINPQENDVCLHSVHTIDEIKRLKDAAMVLASSHSVQVQAAEYMKKKTVHELTEQASVYIETQSSGSTLFRNGIKRRNVRKLREHQFLQQVTCNYN